MFVADLGAAAAAAAVTGVGEAVEVGEQHVEVPGSNPYQPTPLLNLAQNLVPGRGVLGVQQRVAARPSPAPSAPLWRSGVQARGLGWVVVVAMRAIAGRAGALAVAGTPLCCCCPLHHSPPHPGPRCQQRCLLRPLNHHQRCHPDHH